MARFFAHVRTATALIPDSEGFELEKLGKVHANCARVAADLVASDPSARDWTFEIADETGRTVLTLPLRDCLEGGNPNASASPLNTGKL
jgi:hypothetical protein